MFTTLNVKDEASSENLSYDVSGSGKLNPWQCFFLLSSLTLLTVPGCKFWISLLPVTPNQIERLYSRFTSLDRGDCGTLSREDFLRIPELAINPLGDRIVHAFFEEGGCSDRVNFLQFMQVLAHFRPIKKGRDNKLNSREQKLKCDCDNTCECRVKAEC